MLRVRDDDTIVAVSTASGRSGIGIVRVSGPLVTTIAGGVLGKVPKQRVATRSLFSGGDGNVIDSGLALYFRSPHSYTGEDVLELHGHGNPLLLAELLRRCCELGARQAEPGEFTQRAFFNNKLDLAQAEGVAALIDAKSIGAARSALRSLSGEFSKQSWALRDQLVSVRLRVESDLDFPEEDIEVEQGAIRQSLRSLANDFAKLLEGASKGRLLMEGAHLVLLGRTNVGKSSLMNALARENVSIVTDIPGTTRDAVREPILIGNVPVILSDTAGIRDTTEKVELLGIERTEAELRQSDLVLVVTEADRGITIADRELANRVPLSVAKIWVQNKIDLLDCALVASEVDGDVVVGVSAKSGLGMDQLRLAILAALGYHDAEEATFSARERHITALTEASNAIKLSLVSMDLEIIAEQLRLAQQSLGRVTGEFTSDDLLGEIFSRFCIGK